MEPEEDPRIHSDFLLGRFYRKYNVLVLSILMFVLVNLPPVAYGILMECGHIQSISPGAFYVTIQMIMQPCLIDSEDYISRKHLRKILIIGCSILSLGAILAGVTGLVFNERNITFSLFYGPLGGIGAFLITTIVRRILQIFFGNTHHHVVDVVHSSSLGFSQLLFPILLAQIRISFGAQMSVLFLGSILLHTLPIGILLSRSKVQLSVHNLVRYQSVVLEDHGMKRWENLMGINNNCEENDEFVGKKLTNQGVEIMDTILEEDEISERSERSVVIIHKRKSIKWNKWNICREYWQECRKISGELFLNPFRILAGNQKIIPGIFLRALSIFVHILVLSGLPCFTATNTLHLNSVESSIILTIMAIPIIVITFSSISMEDLLEEKGKYWHIMGEIAKFLGCIVVATSQSLFFLRLGVLLLGAGEGINIIQERILRKCSCAEFSEESTWKMGQSYISAVSGYIVLIFVLCTNHFLFHFDFGTIFLITGLFYGASIFTFTLVHYF